MPNFEGDGIHIANPSPFKRQQTAIRSRQGMKRVIFRIDLRGLASHCAAVEADFFDYKKEESPLTLKPIYILQYIFINYRLLRHYYLLLKI